METGWIPYISHKKKKRKEQKVYGNLATMRKEITSCVSAHINITGFEGVTLYKSLFDHMAQTVFIYLF